LIPAGTGVYRYSEIEIEPPEGFDPPPPPPETEDEFGGGVKSPFLSAPPLPKVETQAEL
jgi:hypothetical protein